MKVFRSYNEVCGLKNPVVAVGSFDGVHLGHCRILQYLCNHARQINGDSVVMTFDPHPQERLHHKSDFFRINTLETNLALIEKQGVDAVVIIPFTLEFSKMSYETFLEEIVIGKIHASSIVMGPNHALGHNREGSHTQIETLCTRFHLEVVELPELFIKDAAVHSAEIRKLIRLGRLDDASQMLGYTYPGVSQSSCVFV